MSGSAPDPTNRAERCRLRTRSALLSAAREVFAAQGVGASTIRDITDAVMPGMGGAELASRIAGRGISLKTIFVSGYPGEDIIEQEGLSPDSVFLQKPFTVSALTSLVQNHLQVNTGSD